MVALVSVEVRAAQSSPSKKPSAEELAAKRLEALNSYEPNQVTSSVINQVSEDSFSLKLSKHLSDYRRGEGYLSKETAGEIYQRLGRAAARLSENDPRAAASFNAYSTGFSYESRARFVQGVEQSSRTSATLLELGRKLSKIA